MNNYEALLGFFVNFFLIFHKRFPFSVRKLSSVFIFVGRLSKKSNNNSKVMEGYLGWNSCSKRLSVAFGGFGPQ